MTAALERKAWALLGPRAPLHKWTPGRLGWYCRVPCCGARSAEIDDTRACWQRLDDATRRTVKSYSKEPGNIRGKRREFDTLDMIIALKPVFSWICVVRPATSEEDAQGIDIVITTPRGKLFVQVKSDRASARKWRKKHRETIGPRTMLVRWDGDRIADPVNMADVLHGIYERLGGRKASDNLSEATI